MIKYQIKPASISLMKKLLELIYLSQRNNKELLFDEIAEILNKEIKERTGQENVLTGNDVIEAMAKVNND